MVMVMLREEEGLRRRESQDGNRREGSRECKWSLINGNLGSPPGTPRLTRTPPQTIPLSISIGGMKVLSRSRQSIDISVHPLSSTHRTPHKLLRWINRTSETVAGGGRGWHGVFLRATNPQISICGEVSARLHKCGK